MVMYCSAPAVDRERGTGVPDVDADVVVAHSKV